jgi:hypothetical protein
VETKRSWWQKVKKPLLVAGLITVSIFLLVTIVGAIGGYFFHWDWTGFNTGTNQITVTNDANNSHVIYTVNMPLPQKTLWDWLQLVGILAIPFVVGFGVAWYTERHNHDLQIMTETQRETALQAFIDKIPDLKEQPLEGVSEQASRNRIILKARTITLLSSLDVNRKGTVLKFLYELNLIRKNERQQQNDNDSGDEQQNRRINTPIIELAFADLSGVNLVGFNLSDADLSNTNLRNSDLARADLSGADLSGADLSGANLNGAIVTDEQLAKAKSLRGATLRVIHP